jgi:tRNA (cmo5U34)-methyltransferase
MRWICASMGQSILVPARNLEDTAEHAMHEGNTMDRSEGELDFSFARFAEGFDKHIRQSIRGYADLMSDCVALSEYFVENGTVVFDIGSSTGTFLREVRNKNHARAPLARYVGIDIEDKFKSQWEELRLAGLELSVADIRSFPIPRDCAFVTSIFSMQFIPESDRQRVVDQIYQALRPGGAMIVAEKTLSKLPKLNDMLTFIHYDFKRRSFTEAEILAKERSLRSLMKLWSEQQIIDSITAAGFAAEKVQCFWRNHNFTALIALK